MYNQFNDQALAFGKQFADYTVKAQGAALKSFEQIGGLQTKALKEQLDAQSRFASEAGEVTDFESLQALWTRGVDFSRERAEKFAATQQDVLAVVAKNAQLMADLGREQFETVSEAVTAAPKAAKKASK